ncbi:MAG: hypothetical protein ACREO9_04850, partial [Lysobacterales bacterium]
MKKSLSLKLAFLLVVLCAAVTGTLYAQQQTPGDRVLALKDNLAASQASLHRYQWIETTIVSYKGEQKSSVAKQCSYGADGVLQNVEVSATQAQAPGGLRGRVAANKKEDMTAYMQSAVGLVKTYVPPDIDKIQAVVNAGGMSMQPLPAQQSGRLVLANYEKPGDSMGIEIDLATNYPKGLTINTYLDDPSDAVTLNVTMGQLPDGTIYNSVINLD